MNRGSVVTHSSLFLQFLSIVRFSFIYFWSSEDHLELYKTTCLGQNKYIRLQETNYITENQSILGCGHHDQCSDSKINWKSLDVWLMQHDFNSNSRYILKMSKESKILDDLDVLNKIEWIMLIGFSILVNSGRPQSRPSFEKTDSTSKKWSQFKLQFKASCLQQATVTAASFWLAHWLQLLASVSG